MKKYITPALLSLLLLALTAFVPITAKAQSQNGGLGAGGSTSIIGLPSGRAYFQDATSQAQNGTYNNPAGGANLLQENKAALLIVDSPAGISAPVTQPEVSSSNIWWALILAIAALFSLAGIIIVLMPRSMWRVDSEENKDQLLSTDLVEEPAIIPELETVTIKAEEPVASELQTEQPQEPTQEVLDQVGVVDTEPNKVQVVEIESEEEINEKANKKPPKKRKHGGRPAKKSRK